MGKDVKKRRGGNRHIEDGVTRSKAHRFCKGAERMGNATLGCERCCFVSILIHQADDWESRLFVSRQMYGANDAAAADDNDGKDLLRPGCPERSTGRCIQSLT